MDDIQELVKIARREHMDLMKAVGRVLIHADQLEAGVLDNVTTTDRLQLVSEAHGWRRAGEVMLRHLVLHEDQAVSGPALETMRDRCRVMAALEQGCRGIVGEPPGLGDLDGHPDPFKLIDP